LKVSSAIVIVLLILKTSYWFLSVTKTDRTFGGLSDAPLIPAGFQRNANWQRVLPIKAFRRNQGIPEESRHSGGIKAFRRNQGIPEESRHSGGIKAFRRNQGIPEESRHSGGIKAFRRNQGIPEESRHSGGIKAFRRNQGIPEESRHSGGIKHSGLIPECSTEFTRTAMHSGPESSLPEWYLIYNIINMFTNNYNIDY
jgi:hypothetical protein